jgi:hypothetical protein
VHEAEVYVVRVYRRNAGGVSGIVENVRHGTSQTFHGASELVDLILGDQPPGSGTPDPNEGGL